MAGEGQMAWDASMLAIENAAGFVSNGVSLANDGLNGVRKFFKDPGGNDPKEIEAQKKLDAQYRMIRRAKQKKRMEEQIKDIGFNSIEDVQAYLGETDGPSQSN